MVPFIPWDWMPVVPDGLPGFRVPSIDFSRADELFPMAMTLALIAFLEAISIAKRVGEKHREYTVNPDQELIALGLSNMVGSFFQSYPTTAGFSRTAVNNRAGAVTSMAAIVSALVVGLTLAFLTPLFYYLPKAVLAAIVMTAVFGLIDLKYPLKLYRHAKDEFVLLLMVFIVTLTVGIKEGILLGVLVSLLLLVYRASRPHMAVLGKIKGTDYYRNVGRFADDVESGGQVLIIRFDAQLFFGNKDYFKNELLKILDKRAATPKAIIINAGAISYIDSSAGFMLGNFVEELNDRGIMVLFSDVIGPARDMIKKSGLLDRIGKEHFFVNTSEAHDYALHKVKKTGMQKKVALQSGKSPRVT